MFPSISRAYPDTEVTTSFIADRAMTIVVQSAFSLRVNSMYQGNTINVYQGDLVEAVLTSPIDYYLHQFYHYTLDGVPQYFAVVCRGLYSLSVKSGYRDKRWYDFTPTEHRLTFSDINNVGSSVDLGITKVGKINLSSNHIVMEPSRSSLYFYNTTGALINRILLSNPPKDYQILADKDLLVVLTNNGNFCIVTTDSKVSIVANYSVNCMIYDGSRYLWLAGNDQLVILDTNNNYSVVSTYTLQTECALNITLILSNTAALIVTKTNKLIKITSSGVYSQVYQGVALGQPANFGLYVYIPEGQTERLFIYNPATNAFRPRPLSTQDFSPKFAVVKDDKMYVGGNDSHEIWVFDQYLLYTTIEFPDKVAWVSVVSGTVIASHWLTEQSFLTAPDLARIGRVTFNKKRGPVTHIGSGVSQVHTLGYNVVTAYTSGDILLWVNGIKTASNGVRGTDLVDLDYFNLSYKALVPGRSQVACVVGDSAYDYEIEAFTETYSPRFIDFPVGRPSGGVYRFQITMPNKMTPCTMAIEYGTLLLNGAPYNGGTTVSAYNYIDIEIPVGNSITTGSGTAPIFTLGARQFAVPISQSGASPLYVDSADNLAPGTPVTQSLTVSAESSLYDFIIPNYYNVVVKKNGIVISGNYYQQFGANDVLEVSYSSSVKRYDTEVVYILGATSYRFMAQNIVATLIGYLNFSPIADLYTRYIPKQLTDFGLVEIDPDTSSLTLTPATTHSSNLQATSDTLTLTGTVGQQLDLKLIGGDVYFLIDGNLVTTDTGNITAYVGNTIAIARNVYSYFDSNVTVIQTFTDTDGDTIDFAVGNWPIVNKVVGDVDFASHGTAATYAAPVADFDPTNLTTMESSVGDFEINPHTQSNGAYAYFEPNNLTSYTQSIPQKDARNTVGYYPASLGDIDIYAEVCTSDASVGSFLTENAKKAQGNTAQFIVYTLKEIQTSTPYALIENTEKVKASTVQFIVDNTEKVKASTVQFIVDNSEEVKASTVQFIVYNSEEVLGSSPYALIENTPRVKTSSPFALLENNTRLESSSPAWERIVLVGQTASTPAMYNQDTPLFVNDINPSWYRDSVIYTDAVSPGFLTTSYVFRDTTIPKNNSESNVQSQAPNPSLMLFSYVSASLPLTERYVDNDKYFTSIAPSVTSLGQLIFNGTEFVFFKNGDSHYGITPPNRDTTSIGIPMPSIINPTTWSDNYVIESLEFNKLSLDEKLTDTIAFEKGTVKDTKVLITFDPSETINFVNVYQEMVKEKFSRSTLKAIDYKRTEQDSSVTNYSSWQKPVEHDVIMKISYMRLLPMDSASLLQEFNVFALMDHDHTPTYQKFQETAEHTTDMQYQQFQETEHPTDMLYQQFQKLEHLTNMEYQRDQRSTGGEITQEFARIERDSFTVPAPTPLLNSDKLWEQEVGPLSLAFLTAADALLFAADNNYTMVTPYLIYNSEFYSFRVLLDTGLVCRVPKGRYPVAWLLHGG